MIVKVLHRCVNDHEQPWAAFVQFEDGPPIRWCYQCWAEAMGRIYPTEMVPPVALVKGT